MRAVGIALALALLVAADRAGMLALPTNDLRRYDDRTFSVERVVDGDTLVLAATDGKRDTTRVRLWAVNAPELARPEEGKPAEPLAEAARERVAALIEGERVTLDLEPHRLRDKHDRVLAFVTLPDGRVVNELLVTEGLARADARWPHRDVERYATLEKAAKKAKVGLWAPSAAR